MKLNTRESKNNTLVIDLEGDLDVFSCVSLKKEVDRIFQEGNERMVINLEKVPYIDSRGIGVLIYTHSLFKKSQKKFFLINVIGSVRRVIELTKLLGYLPIANTEDDALQKMA